MWDNRFDHVASIFSRRNQKCIGAHERDEKIKGEFSLFSLQADETNRHESNYKNARLIMKHLFGNLERVFGYLEEVSGSRAPAKTFVELSVCFQF